MGSLDNLQPFTKDNAKEMQKRSVESRNENKIKRRLIEDAIRKNLTDQDLLDIARGIIERSKTNTYDLVAMRDTLGEKPIEVQQVIETPIINDDI